MAGTKAGGKKAAVMNKKLYGVNFYAKIGRRGGKTVTLADLHLKHATRTV